MKKWLLVLTCSVFILFVVVNCSSDKSPLVSKAHPEDWNLQTAENFHGNKVLEAGHTSCKSCHGAEFEGGASKVSCHTCHASYPHTAAWSLFDNPQNHDQFIKDNNFDFSKCKTCHGEDLKGGRSGVSCYSCHPEHSGDS